MNQSINEFVNGTISQSNEAISQSEGIDVDPEETRVDLSQYGRGVIALEIFFNLLLNSEHLKAFSQTENSLLKYA